MKEIIIYYTPTTSRKLFRSISEDRDNEASPNKNHIQGIIGYNRGKIYRLVCEEPTPS